MSDSAADPGGPLAQAYQYQREIDVAVQRLRLLEVEHKATEVESHELCNAYRATEKTIKSASTEAQVAIKGA